VRELTVKQMLENKEIDQVLTQMGCWNDDPASGYIYIIFGGTTVFFVVQWGFSVGTWDTSLTNLI